ncbi:unnamed protein product, partial [Cyprideis torosa]
INEEWTMGPELCDMWTSSDVLCCTASILHLLAIAADRYMAVTNINYIHSRSTRQVSWMIGMIWLAAAVVSLAPIFGWKDDEFRERVIEFKRCMVSQDIGYQIFATMATFYAPLLVTLFLYYKIFQAARRRIRRRLTTTSTSRLVPSSSGATGTHEATNTTQFTTATTVAAAAPLAGGLRDDESHEKTILEESTSSPPLTADEVRNNNTAPLPPVEERNGNVELVEQTTRFDENPSPQGTTGRERRVRPKLPPRGSGQMPSRNGGSLLGRRLKKIRYSRKSRENLEMKRERKAAKTLMIVTGAFIVCWLPFFVVALIGPICREACPWLTDSVFSVFLWLGYLNSALNPIIYTIFSPDFRAAFKKILCGTKSLRRRGT